MPFADTTIFSRMRARDKYKIIELEAEIGLLKKQIKDYPDVLWLSAELKRKQAQIERIKLRNVNKLLK